MNNETVEINLAQNQSMMSTASNKSNNSSSQPQKANKTLNYLLLSLPDEFQNKSELLSLHKESSILQSQLKFRKDLDIQYAKLKLKSLQDENSELNFQKKFANKRNDNLLASIQDDQFKQFSISSNSEDSKKKILEFRQKFSDYYQYQTVQIRKEFNYQLIAKQNELLAAKAVYENQVRQNEKILKMENDYYERICEMNMKITEKIKMLQLKNEQIAQERAKRAKEYQEMQRKLNENMYNAPSLEIISSKVEQNEPVKEIEIKDSVNPLTKSKKYRTIIEKEYKLNMNHKPGKLDAIRQQQLDDLIKIRKSSLGKSQKQSIISNERYNEANAQEEQINKSFKKGVTFGDNNKEEEITNKQNEDKKEEEINQKKDSNIFTKIDSNIVESNIGESKVISEKDDIKQSMKMSLKQSNTDDEFQVSERDKEKVPQNKEEEDKKEQIPPENKTNEQKPDIPVMKRESKNSIKLPPSLKDSLIVPIEEEKHSQNEEVIDSDSLTPYQKLLRSKPPLNSPLVLVEYKLQVLKKLIPKIEKHAASLKPGKFLYQIKHSKTKNNKEILKEKFYELLTFIRDQNDKVDEKFSSLDIEMSLQFIFELLFTNPKHNINEENLVNKQNYEEADFDKDFDKEYKVMFKLILEHFRKMITSKKVSIQVACNFLSKAILNFEHNEIMQSKLLLILEKKLAQRSRVNIQGTKTFSNTFTSGFNVKIDTTKTKESSKSIAKNEKMHKSTKDVFDDYE